MLANTSSNSKMSKRVCAAGFRVRFGWGHAGRGHALGSSSDAEVRESFECTKGACVQRAMFPC